MSGCKKVRYGDEVLAKIALASLRAEGRRTKREEQRIYHCRHCKGWHLTSQPFRDPAASKAAP